jgi:lipopolysaccharide/colanic/teichoic acid biosynthesis glycosyltransferase
VVTGIWLVALRAAQASAPFVLGPWVPAAIGSTTGVVAVAAVNPYLPGLQLPLVVLLGMGLGVCVSAGLWEHVLEHTTPRKVLVVGSSALADIQAAQLSSHLPFELLAGEHTPSAHATGTAGALIPQDLAPVVEAQRPDVIVLADEESVSRTVERLLDITDRRFHVHGLTSFYEHAFGRVPLSELKPAWFISLLNVRQRAPRRPSKRLFDIAVAVVGLLLTALLLPLLAIAIRATIGPVFYRQVRVGEGGRRFTMLKLRTMPATAESDGAVYAAPDDPRAPRFGRFLRRTHLDELPQLWNVLKGDMSIVGPRPERPEHIQMLEAGVPYWSRRLLMKPGITGWAQIRCGYAADCATAAEKLSHDFWYMRHGGLAVDVAVCLSTLRIVLGVCRPLRALARLRTPREQTAR